MKSPRHKAITAAALLLLAAVPALAQHEDISIYSTANGSGTLVIDYDFGPRQRVTNRLPGGMCPGGSCFYSSTNPGFVTPRNDEPGEGLFALNGGTPISFVVQAIAEGTSVKLGSFVVDAPGESTLIGVVDIHRHPEWQVEAPDGTIDDFPVTFLLRDTSGTYDDSEPVTLVLTNDTSSPSQLGLLFGNTAYAAALTLAIFFLGLSLGSYAWGNRAARSKQPLRTYALLELGIALAALGYFALLRKLQPQRHGETETTGTDSALRLVADCLESALSVPPWLRASAVKPGWSFLILISGMFFRTPREIRRSLAVMIRRPSVCAS